MLFPPQVKGLSTPALSASITLVQPCWSFFLMLHLPLLIAAVTIAMPLPNPLLLVHARGWHRPPPPHVPQQEEHQPNPGTSIVDAVSRDPISVEQIVPLYLVCLGITELEGCHGRYQDTCNLPDQLDGFLTGSLRVELPSFRKQLQACSDQSPAQVVTVNADFLLCGAVALNVAHCPPFELALGTA
eukprot:1942967-Rhodomonas_salina.2